MYAEFEYLRPAGLTELLELLAQKREGTAVYAGGTDLLVELRARKRQAGRLIDIKGVPSLGKISEREGCLSIGGACTFSEIAASPLVRRWAPALVQAAGAVGSVQIRNKATLAGNIQTASPAGDGLNAALALDGTAVLLSLDGERRVPLTEHIRGPRSTLLEPGELLAAVELPLRAWSCQRFFKVGRRNALAISVVNGTVALELEGGRAADARICVGAAGPTPVRMEAAEGLLRGQAMSEELIERVAQTVREQVRPISDLRASAEYRSYMAGTMTGRLLRSFWKGGEL